MGKKLNEGWFMKLYSSVKMYVFSGNIENNYQVNWQIGILEVLPITVNKFRHQVVYLVIIVVNDRYFHVVQYVHKAL